MSTENPISTVAITDAPQGPLLGSIDTLFEAIRLLGIQMSGMPYRHPGTLNVAGDLWESLDQGLTSEALAEPFSAAKEADARNFANNQARVINKILSSLPGGAGNDVRTRAAVQRIAGYIGKYGPTALQALKANLGEDEEDSPLGSLVSIMESAFDAFYGQIGSQASAMSVLSSSMRGAVPIQDRADRLSAYRQARYALDNRDLLHGASAQEDATYLAMAAMHNVSPLNMPTENSLNLFNEMISNGGINDETLERMARRHVMDTNRQLLNSGTMQQAIRTFSKNNSGGDINLERMLNSYATQIDIRSNLEQELNDSGLWNSSVNLLNERDLSNISVDIAREYNKAKAENPNSERTVALENLQKNFNAYYSSQQRYREAGGTLSAMDISQGIIDQRLRNIEAASAAYPMVTEQLQRAIALRNDLQRRQNDIGTIEDLADNNKWWDLASSGTVDNTTADLLMAYFSSTDTTPSLHTQFTNFFNNLVGAEQGRLQNLLTQYNNAPDKQKFFEENKEAFAPFLNTAVGTFAAGQNFTAALADMGVALATTNSTIGGQPFNGPQDTHTFINMLFQGEWGRVPASTYNQSIPAIASGMIRTGTNADQVLQYAGLAAKKAKEVGGDPVTSSIWGAEAALATRIYQREHQISNSHLPSYTANAMGLAPSSTEGRILNALSARLTEENIEKIKDPKNRAIAQKILKGETLSNDEIATLGREGQVIFSDLGYSAGAMDAALSADYSRESFAQRNAANVAAYYMSSQRLENVDIGTDTITNYLYSVNMDKAAENDTVTRTIYDVAVSNKYFLSYKKENKEAAKKALLERLKQAGVPNHIIQQFAKMDPDKIVDMFRNTVQNIAEANGVETAEEWMDVNAMGQNLVPEMKKANIVANAWNNAPRGDQNGFSRALATIRNNPNATLTDVIAAAIRYNLGDEDKGVLAGNAAVASIFSPDIDTGLDQNKEARLQSILLQLTDAFGGDSNKAAEVLRKAANGWEGMTEEERKVVQKAGIKPQDIMEAGKDLNEIQKNIKQKIDNGVENPDDSVKARIQALKDREAEAGNAEIPVTPADSSSTPVTDSTETKDENGSYKPGAPETAALNQGKSGTPDNPVYVININPFIDSVALA